jgi:hypothetical protein
LVSGGRSRSALRAQAKAAACLRRGTRPRAKPPFRFIAGADAIAQAEQKLAERQQQIDAYRDFSTSLALDEAGDDRDAAGVLIGAHAAVTRGLPRQGQEARDR